MELPDRRYKHWNKLFFLTLETERHFFLFCAGKNGGGGGARDSGGSQRSRGGGVRPRPVSSPARPWFIPGIRCHEPEDGVYFAQIGPTGGEMGYQAITGK